MGQLHRRIEIINWLKIRLLLQNTLNNKPAILDEKMRRPWFVMGLPRSGTTFLHRLLAQDPGLRAPLSWELTHFFPVPEQPPAGRDPRIIRAERTIRQIVFFFPESKAIHETEAEIPEECLFLLANGLITGQIGDLSEESRQWVAAQDLTGTYQLHKQYLQVLQHKAPPHTWLLKCPLHLAHLEWLLKVYPDACIMQTHRDPVEVASSLASLMAPLVRLKYENLDLKKVGEWSLNQLAQMAETGSRMRDQAAAAPTPCHRIVDVRYADLVRDPLPIVEKIYESFEVELGPKARQRMETFLQANKQHKHGRHDYDPTDFGLDPGLIRERFAGYSRRFLQA